MINFIVVDDFKEIITKVEKILTKTMINDQIEYKIHTFDDYNSNFMNLVNSDLTNRIYFLDIETKSASGLDIARMIRKNDIDSVIIFITAHEELGGAVAREQLMALTFICKFDDFDSKVEMATHKALEIIGKKKVIRFNDHSSLYTIPVNDILYVTRDSVERKCVIKTDYTVYKVGKSLMEIKDMGFGKLLQAHRSCLINIERVQKIDKRNNEIIFDTGEKIDMLSNIYKKEIATK